jgi:hypothetical protein
VNTIAEWWKWRDQLTNETQALKRQTWNLQLLPEIPHASSRTHDSVAGSCFFVKHPGTVDWYFD